MKIVHYEYRLKTFTRDGEIGVQLIAKPIKHYADAIEFLPTDDLMPVKQPRKKKTGVITTRYYFGVSNKQNVKPASEPGFSQQGDHQSRGRDSKESWCTCLRR